MNKLAKQSIVYLGATVTPRLLGVILIPVYSHYLLPREYGIFGLANTINQLLYMVMTFGLVSAVSRFYFDASDADQRRIMMGQIAVFLLLAPLRFLGLIEWRGEQIFHLFTPDVSYKPYLRIVSWTTFFSMFAVVPLMVLRSQERAKLYASLTIGQAVLYHTLAIVLVLYFGYGVLGLLWSNLLSTLVLVPVFLLLTVPMISIHPSVRRMKSLLNYSMPLIPHSIAGWVLNLSDRIVLQHWVALSDIGVYSLGYTLGGSVQNIADAVNTSWFPSFYRSQTTGIAIQETLRTATYMLGIVCGAALIVAVGAHHFVAWFLPVSYAGSENVVLWVAMSAVFILMYYIWSFSVHYSKRTWYLPIVTWSAALSNIGLNILLIPKYGYVAAAFDTFLAYFLMAFICAFIARKLYPVVYEYRRWTILVTTTLCFAGAAYVRPNLYFFWDLMYSLALLFGWPVVLGVFGYYSESEVTLWKTVLQHLLRGRVKALSQ